MAKVSKLKAMKRKLKATKKKLAVYRKLDAQAATYVESLICMRSGHFTAETPYVGWKGLGLALREDYDDLDALLALVADLDVLLPDPADSKTPPDGKTYEAKPQKGPIDYAELRRSIYKRFSEDFKKLAG